MVLKCESKEWITNFVGVLCKYNLIIAASYYSGIFTEGRSDPFATK